MTVKERVRYGSRGQGSLIRYEGVANWYSCYCVHGKEVRESTETPDLKIARRVHKRLLDQLAVDRQGKGKFVTPTEARVTVRELVAELEADYRLRGVRSLAQARAHLGLPTPVAEGEQPKPPRTIVAAFGHWRASEITAAAIDGYVERRLAEGAAPATVNRETQLLGQALRLGVERGKLVAAPKVRRLREENVRRGFFESGEYQTVLGALPAHLQDVARFAYLSGWRRGEILSLTWADVDRAGAAIRLRPEHSKNRHGRTLAIEGALVSLIEHRWQARQLKGPDGTVCVAELVFHRAGRPIVDFRKAWAVACKAAGIPAGRAGRTFHDFRRTAARNMVRAGVRERVAMEITGHRTRSMFDRYNIVSEDDLRAAMRQQTEYVEALPTAATVTPITAAQATSR